MRVGGWRWDGVMDQLKPCTDTLNHEEHPRLQQHQQEYLAHQKTTTPIIEFRVQGSGFRSQGSGFRVQGSGLRVQGSKFRVSGFGIRVWGFGFRVQSV